MWFFFCFVLLFSIYPHLKLGKAFQTHSKNVWLMLAILDSAGLSHTSNFWRQRQERPQGRLLEIWIVFKIYGRLGSGKDVAGISKSYLSESHNDRSELSAERIQVCRYLSCRHLPLVERRLATGEQH